MPVVVEQRKLYRQPGSGAIRANRAHFAAADLQYLYVPQHGLLRNVVGSGEILPRLSNAAFAGTVDGWGASSTSSSSGFQLSSIPRINALNSAITLLWRGVMFGDTAGNNVILFGQTLGNYAANPYTVAAVGRAGTSGQNLLSLFSNNGAGGFLNWQFDCGLSSHYGRVVTFAVSQRPGVGGADAVFVTPTSTTVFSNVGNAQSQNSGNPRGTSSSDELFVGGAASDSTRHPNASMTLAAAWSRALTLEQLVRLAQDPWSVTQGSRVVVPFGLGGANIQSGSPTPAAGTATVSGTGAATAAATATAAAGAASVSAAGASTAAATATAADGTATVSATGAATAAATATAADGTATVSATGAATAAATATAAAGEASVSAAGATAGATGQPPQGFLLLFGTLFDAPASGIVAGSPTAAAGVATVSAVGAARAAADPVAAAGEALVSAVGSTGGSISAADPTAAAGAATVSAIGAARAAATATAADGVATVSAIGAATAAATATAAAGEASVSAVGSTGTTVAAGDPVAAAGAATVSAVGAARAAADPVAAAGEASVSATGAAVGVFAATAVPAAGQATVSAAGADANAVPSQPGSGRARLRGPATWSDPLNDDDLTRDDDELLEIVAALAATGVLDGLARLPGSARI